MIEGHEQTTLHHSLKSTRFTDKIHRGIAMKTATSDPSVGEALLSKIHLCEAQTLGNIPFIAQLNHDSR